MAKATAWMITRSIKDGMNEKSGLTPAQTVDKKAILPRRGRIALSANERIAEFLSFAIRAKFAYVNKLCPFEKEWTGSRGADRRERKNPVGHLYFSWIAV